MKWLKKLFCKFFGCKCGCQEGKECKCSGPKNVTTDEIKVTEKKSTKKNTKKKITKKTNKKAKK